MVGTCLVVYTVVTTHDVSVTCTTFEAELVLTLNTCDPNESVLNRVFLLCQVRVAPRLVHFSLGNNCCDLEHMADHRPNKTHNGI
jgi:hypothetical protein